MLWQTPKWEAHETDVSNELRWSRVSPGNGYSPLNSKTVRCADRWTGRSLDSWSACSVQAFWNIVPTSTGQPPVKWGPPPDPLKRNTFLCYRTWAGHMRHIVWRLVNCTPTTLTFCCCLHIHIRVPVSSFIQDFWLKFCTQLSSLLLCHTPHPSNPPSFDHTCNI